MGGLTHVLEEAVKGSRVIKVYGGQQHEAARFHEVANWIRRYSMKITTTASASVPLVQLIAVIALAVVIYITAMNPAWTVGGFVSFFGAAAMLLPPIKRLTALNEQMQRGLAAAESVFQLFDEEAEPDSGTRTLGRAVGRIEFERVSLQYGATAGALQDVSLAIEPGETVALVGSSGAGKSSLINLVPRFYAPTSGRVLIDGIDIQHIRLADLRANISLVTQDVVLFNDTVAANIAYGSSRSATRAAIVAADGVRGQVGGGARHADRGEWTAAVGRTTPAPGDRARAAAERTDPDHGRGHLGARLPDRAAGTVRPR
jgi:subfamily B ATP-binding cassette protein MsbA